MREILIGTKFRIIDIVKEKDLALTVKSGSLRVFATPMMIALMENCSANTLSAFLDKEETSVGTFISISHISATPVGMEVFADCKITEVNGKEITFKISASDQKGLIGEGIHKRFIVNSEKFQKKTDLKLMPE